MIDVREIKLNMRYPDSRQEDITDAFTRGYTGAVEIGNKVIKKLEAENAKLRELVRHLYVCNQRLWIDNGVCVCALCPYLEYDCEFEQRILDLGIEVQP